MKAKEAATQTEVVLFADFVWEVLSEIFGRPNKKRPPLYLFLSPESKGSLSKRNSFERMLVHQQQSLGEGVTLHSPPLAYVSFLHQVPEETAHLYALCRQKKEPRLLQSETEEEIMIVLHEAFGRFCQHLVHPQPIDKKYARLKTRRLWERAHNQGYRLGDKMAKCYFLDKLNQIDLRKWLSMNWHNHRSAKRALNFIKARCRIV